MATKQNKPAPAAEPKPAESETPEWVYSTPEEPRYLLAMESHDGADIITPEEMEITRQEYIAVKHLIAKMRGHDLTPPEDATESKLWPRVMELTPAPEEEPRRRRAVKKTEKGIK